MERNPRIRRKDIKPEAPPKGFDSGRAPGRNFGKIFRKAYMPSQVYSGSAQPSALPAPSKELHLLSRISFGVTEKTLAGINSMGTDVYLEKQLDYKSIPDKATEKYVGKKYPSLKKSVTQLLTKREWDVGNEMKHATAYRAIHSNRQLFEVMVDFWNTHFSIYIWDDYATWTKVEDDRSVIRPHALGKFPDMLKASSKSTAMLTYLDNHYNYQDGPNENYARELLELHSMGVDNGYTQKDVEEVARCLTGWSMNFSGKKLGQFKFNKGDHDQKSKTVLGENIPANGGIRDGEKVVEILAEHPSTAWFISFKLCRRFVSDSPPKALVTKISDIYINTGGDIKDMLRGIFSSTEFWNSADQKVKRPFDYVASLLRVTQPKRTKNADGGLNWYLHSLGQTPFEWAPPNGYPEVAEAWINTNGMLRRWNFTLSLSQGWLWGFKSIVEKYQKKVKKHTPQVYVDTLVDELMFRSISSGDYQKLLDFASEGKSLKKEIVEWKRGETLEGLMALILSSSYYQYR